MTAFKAFDKIPRLNRNCIVTEKIDGTNAQVVVTDDGRVLAGSRKRYVTPDDDNFGFATWVLLHEAELRDGLGPGAHYGEWWGPGIQRGYGLKEKRFSLFNSTRWAGERPACCDVVPVLYAGLFCTRTLSKVLSELEATGSKASPGFMRPEGIVVFHCHSGHFYKATIEKDRTGKEQE